MSSNLVIVAVPDENDRVWKVSSEKVPHLTLLFLGDVEQVSNVQGIVDFVEHAASTTLRRFYLPVDRRGELGADQADVLFFKKGRYDFKAIRDFRATLLQDHSIKTAYDSSTQFEGPWTPHLTLGYPAAPANKSSDDQIGQFYDVQFNKIAVWTGDYEGPEFLLKDYWEDYDVADIPMDVAMSDLQHHGVKGQKWGVRKIEGGGPDAHIRINNKTGRASTSKQTTTALVGTVVIMAPLTPAVFLSKRVRAEVKAAGEVNKGVNAQKKIDKADKKFEKHANAVSNFVAIHNGAHAQINQHIAEVNKKYPHDLSKDPKAQKQYDSEILKGMQDAYRTSANQLGNKTGTRHLDVEFMPNGTDFKIVAKKGMQTPTVEPIKHAIDDPPIEFTGKIKRDATGHIVGFEFDDAKDATSAKHTAELGAEFIEHYGIKGMHWGQRKEPPTAVAPQAVSHVPHGSKRKTQIDVAGGENHPAHEDAIKVARAQAKLKKSGTAALSNQELKDMATRLQLESQVSTLSTSRGRKFVTRQFENQSQQVVQKGAQAGVKRYGPRVIKKAGKGAATVAISALL